MLPHQSRNVPGWQVLDNKGEDRCPTCGTYKYRPCSACKPINPSAHVCEKEYHAKTYKRSVFYWPINDKLISSLKGSNSAKYVDYPWTVRDRTHEDESSGVLYDVYDGEAWKNIVDAERYMAKALVRFGLGFYYDGFQPFRRRQFSMWAGFMFILNWPPSLRHRLGVGLHLVILHNVTKGAASKQVLEPVVDGLLELWVGVTVKLSQIDERLCANLQEQQSARLRRRRLRQDDDLGDDEGVVRAALVLTILDLKGWEELMHIQGTGSLEGCPFCEVKSVSLKHFESRVVLGARKYITDKNHYLRKKMTTSLDALNARKRFLEEKAKERRRQLRTQGVVPPPQKLDRWKSATMRFNEKEDSNRPREMTHDDYMRAAAEVERNKVKGRDVVVCGVKGMCILCRLPYWRRDYVFTCPLHEGANMSKNLNANLYGERGCTASVRKEEEVLQRFHHQFQVTKNSTSKKGESIQGGKEGKSKKKEEKFRTPWRLASSEKEIVTSRLSSICYPTSYSEVRLDDFVTYHRTQKSINRIRFMTCFQRFAYRKPILTREYRLMMSTISEALCGIFREHVWPEELEQASQKLAEGLAMKEGLLPITEQMFADHIALHIPRQIEIAGPVLSFWMAPGERGNQECGWAAHNATHPVASAAKSMTITMVSAWHGFINGTEGNPCCIMRYQP